jgi:hypothetical protein
MRLTLKDFDAFEELLFAPEGVVRDTRISGYGGRDDSGHPTSLALTYRFEGEGNELELRADRRVSAVPSWAQLYLLTSRALSNAFPRHGRVRFPLELRIERESLAIRVNGRVRKLTVYACGDAMAGFLKVGDAAVWLVGPRHVLTSLSLRTLTRTEYADLARRLRVSRARHRAALAVEKHRKR